MWRAVVTCGATPTALLRVGALYRALGRSSIGRVALVTLDVITPRVFVRMIVSFRDARH